MGRKSNDGRGRLGGRKKDTPNKNSNAELREMVKELSVDTFPEFTAAFHAIEEPAKKCQIWLDMQKYVMPALSSVAISDSGGVNTLKEELDAIASEK